MTAPAPANPTALPPPRWWRCAACGKTLGEVIGTRVVIKVGDRRLSLPAVEGLDQVCPKCGTVSVLEAA